MTNGPAPDRRPILQRSVPKETIDLMTALPRAARLSGKSQVAVAIDLIRSMFDERRLRPKEYLALGGWLGGPEERATVIGKVANARLSHALIGPGPMNQSALMDNKYLAGLVLAANGFPVPEIKAAFSVDASYGRLTTLSSAEALADWLCASGNLPAFAKPTFGARALATIPLRNAGDGLVDIGGRIVEARLLAGEVAMFFPNGWLIQEQLRQPPEIEALIGPGIGSVRVVTLWEDGGPSLMYAVWRQPTPGTWVDATIHDRPNVFCALDADGRVLQAQQGDLLHGQALTHSLVTPGLPMIGVTLAQWPAMLELCLNAHRLFPGHALIGWDIAMTSRGPVISELNARPLHMLVYQRAFRRGFLHAEHRQRLDAAQRLLQERAGRARRRKGHK